ncbi:leucine-rich repeat-containing protein 42 isoform X2 [Corythoichthys intestinalis]|uniref:leucine-rich repeat-containing protein 42 isoform X2 n=1 Tax=Corythoichthys intestinalis TaxID=161448 RepID=UPI0025A67AA4|nr:leucine-rich repeat-containing protein 42 isoform X2 [Corythoichthys intestinalis]XP_061794802.1 leucine-rich repeat-containing protein 42-like [Nerophis lumbriciformis]
MDASGVYVRERGKLRRIGDTVLNPVASSPSSCRRTNALVLRKKHFVFTYNAEGSLRYSSKSLFDIALLFVAGNVHHVDSLVGFPEQIGDRLFAAAEKNRVFLKPDVSPKALRLFSDAYGDMVLGSLCLRNRFPLLSERMADIKTFHSLKCLDLFGCRLGDNHEIFQHLTSTSLASCLIQLFIGGNGLSDEGLQRLTAPVRMMRKGLDCLQCLDVSYNPISERALHYLKCLPKLEKLDVTGTGMTFGTRLKLTMWELLSLTYSEKALHVFDHSGCKTQGWAEQVVNQWETNGAQMPKQKRLDESRISALRFFGRQKFVREVLNAAPLSHNRDATAQEDQRLHFYKPPASSATDAPSTDITFWTSANKRKRPSEKCCDGVNASLPVKRVSSTALTAEDMDLLDQY